MAGTGICIHQVSVAFSDAQLYPGEAVSVELRADAGSLCALGVIDKSVHLLGGNNRLSMGKVLRISFLLDVLMYILYRFYLSSVAPVFAIS